MLSSSSSDLQDELAERKYREQQQLFKRSLIHVLDSCLTTNQCKLTEYCHHEGLNPLGKCFPTKDEGTACAKDRQCTSANCHLFKCGPHKIVKDGTCAPYAHHQCLSSQFCAKRTPVFKCINRLCRGLCIKNAQCLSNRCFIFWCISPPKCEWQ